MYLNADSLISVYFSKYDTTILITMVKDKKLFIARNSDNTLWMYKEKPIKDFTLFTSQDKNFCNIPESYYESIKWDNSPQFLYTKEEILETVRKVLLRYGFKRMIAEIDDLLWE